MFSSIVLSFASLSITTLINEIRNYTDTAELNSIALNFSMLRYYSLADRGVLLGEDWRRNTASYLKQLKCPYGFEKFQNAALDWLLNYAIRLEYTEKKDDIK